jgi:hypothetical protein
MESREASYGAPDGGASYGAPDGDIASADELNVGGYTNSDEPADKDSLGFEPYVEAMAAFLSNPMTSTPLTVSVEGRWGSGKSSFMKQLKRRLTASTAVNSAPLSADRGGLRLRSHAVWFNPWRHEKADALWAAFALVVIRELRNQKTWVERIAGDIALLRQRVNGALGWFRILITTTFWWLTALIVAFGIVDGYVTGHTRIVQLWAHMITSSGKDTSIAETLLKSPWSTRHWVAALILAGVGFFFWWKSHVNNPLELKLERFLKRPEYKGHVAFIEEFHDDFQRVLKAYIGRGRLFVFIDDLDRCADDHVIDLLQATNLMIGSEGPVVFVIGMDREKIAALITQRASALLPFLPEGKDAPHNDAGYGFSYLEKFIQIPFKVPTPSFDSMHQYIERITLTERTPKTSSNGRIIRSRLQVVSVVLGSDAPLVVKLAMICAPYLDRNPRRVKQFINVFRLQAYLAASVGLLDFEQNADAVAYDPVQNITLEQLGKFIAITLRWPTILSDLSVYGDLLRSLAMTAEGSNEPHHLPPQLSHWTTSRLLMALLSAGVSTEGRRYSLKNAPLERLLDIYPLRVAERLKPFVIMESTGSDVVLGRGDSEEDAWRDAAERLKANGENSWQVFSQAAGVGRETETTDPRG